MLSSTRCAAMACACSLALLSGVEAQGSASAGACRQGLLALIVMIDAGEHDKSHYRNTATSVVTSCGPPAPAATPATTSLPFDKAECGRLTLAMLDGIEGSDLGSTRFVQARDAFAGKCLGR